MLSITNAEQLVHDIKAVLL